VCFHFSSNALRWSKGMRTTKCWSEAEAGQNEEDQVYRIPRQSSRGANWKEKYPIVYSSLYIIKSQNPIYLIPVS
jgi:hypothetical protein